LAELPKGKLTESRDCPIAKAVNFGVLVTPYTAYFPSASADAALRYGAAWGIQIRSDGIALPYAIRQFVIDFDAGNYPDLIQKEEVTI